MNCGSWLAIALGLQSAPTQAAVFNDVLESHVQCTAKKNQQQMGSAVTASTIEQQQNHSGGLVTHNEPATRMKTMFAPDSFFPRLLLLAGATNLHNCVGKCSRACIHCGQCKRQQHKEPGMSRANPAVGWL